jgi:CDP-glycerol glycerophosphotransferase
MTRISVVVPMYNVEDYLGSCLRSVEAQTFDDLEVIMVDDGSTDGSSEIAAEFAQRDPRFRLVTQANGGLSKARNTGVAAARGELLAFLDSDDVLPADAYERLAGALQQSGSDFATGNVHRLDGTETRQAAFLARTFARTRMRTHVTRFRPLLADRTAWNKLYSRSFWDRHGFRFPEGRLHEDIPVTLPAHFSARSVDVIAEPVYYWRVRRTGSELSITQRRLEQSALLDRLAAIEEVRDHLVRTGPRRWRRWYERSAIADDLRLHLNLLDQADDEYRRLFLDRAGAFVERAGWGVLRALPAIDRLKWHLVHERRVAELVEVLRFQHEEMATTPPVRIRGRWYGDYPFRTDPALSIPRRVYRLGRSDLNLAPSASVTELSREGDRVVLRGRAAIQAAAQQHQRVRLEAVRPGRWQRLRSRISPVRVPTRATGGEGFEATLDPQAFGRRGWREADWELIVHVRAAHLNRRRSRFVVEAPRADAAVDLPQDGEAMVTVAATAWGKLVVSVRREWMAIRSQRMAGDDVLELAGESRADGGVPPLLELRRESDALTITVPVTGGAGGWTARVPLADLRAVEAPEELADEAATIWELWAVGNGHRIPLSVLASGDVLTRTRHGDGALLVHSAARAAPQLQRT